MLAAEPVTPSIRRLVLGLAPDVRFAYRAGMHVELRTPGAARPRTYSIATAPDGQGLAPDGLLEFFVTRHEGGQASGWLHGPERLGGQVQIHGPYGTLPAARGRLRPGALPRRRLGPGTDPRDRPPRARCRLQPSRSG